MQPDYEGLSGLTKLPIRHEGNVVAPEELELLPTAKTKPDRSVIYPVDPKQLLKELAGVEWPPKG